MPAEFLVIGATGRHGSTGLHIARELRRAGRRVRALARQFGPATEALKAEGVEVVRGDLHDRRSLENALDGVRASYFTYPVGPGIVSAAANYAAAAKKTGVEHSVVMSMAVAHPESPSPLGREQWLAEEILGWSGATGTVLRFGALFLENILTLHARSIRQEHVLRNNFGPAPMSWIAGADAAAIACAALLGGPEGAGVRVHQLPGAFRASHDAIAKTLTDLTGRPIVYQHVPRAAWRDELLALADAGASDVVNPHMAEHISSVAAFLAAGARTAQADASVQSIEAALGRPPIDLVSFLKPHLSQLEPQS